MGPTAPLRANETRKEKGIEIYISKTDQATKYVRPVLFHSLPTKTTLVTGWKLCFSYLHRNKDYKTNHYLSECNLEKKCYWFVVSTSSHSSREKCNYLSLPLSLKCPFDSREKDNYFSPLSRLLTFDQASFLSITKRSRRMNVLEKVFHFLQPE